MKLTQRNVEVLELFQAQFIQEETARSPSPEITVEPAPQVIATQPRRKRLPEDQALENIRRAVQAIMDFNKQGDRSLHEKWYISFPLVQTLLRAHGLSANQANVSTVFAQMKQELEQHQDQHHLGSRHNRRHPDLSKITQFVALNS